MNEILGALMFLMPLPLILVWALVTWGLWKIGKKFLSASFANYPVRLVLVIVVATFWLGVSFWEAGGKKLYWDAKVRELCAIDGGVKVYEQVRLPKERFDKWGKIQIPEKTKMKSKDEYYYESVTTYLRQGNPNIVRHYTKVVRKSDGKVFGESVYYGRGGGDLPGPWHPSGFTCPNPTEKPYLEPSIFQKGDF